MGHQLRPLVIWKGDIVNYARCRFFNQEIDEVTDKVGDASNGVCHGFMCYDAMRVEQDGRNLLCAGVFTVAYSTDIYDIFVSINVHCNNGICITQHKMRSGCSIYGLWRRCRCMCCGWFLFGF